MFNNKNNISESKKIDLLSYYQSTVRNAGMFTTLSLAALAAAHGAKKQKNNVGLYLRYLAALMFILIGLFVSWMLIELDREYEDRGDPLDKWKWLSPTLVFTQISIIFAILLSFLTKLY